MKIKLLLILIIFVLLLNNVNSLKIYKAECFDDGHIEMVIDAGDNKSKVYTNDIEMKIGGIEIENRWDRDYIYNSESAYRQYSTLTTDEGIFNKKEFYFINLDYFITLKNMEKDPKSIQTTVECPGLLFTCSNLGISIDSCSTKGEKFQADLNIKGLKQSERSVMDAKEVVTYRLEAEKNYINIRNLNSKKGELPLNAELKEISKEKYLLEAEFKDNFVRNLWLGYNDNLFFPCTQSDYPNISFYDYKECALEAAEEEIEEIKVEEEPEKIEPQEIEEKKETDKLETEKVQEIKEEVTKTKDYSQLKIMGLIVLIVLLISGVILLYLRKRGYL